MHSIRSYVPFLIPVLFCLSCFSVLKKSPLPYVPEGQEENVLAMITFDQHTPGKRYGIGDVKQDFGTSRSIGTFWPLRRVKIDSSISVRGRVLRVNYPMKKLRSFSSGASWYWRPFEPRQELYFSYLVFFPDSFVFREGGKMHGIVGGKGNTGGKKPTGRDGWSCRVHWGPGDLIKLYIYHKDQYREWGDTFYFTHNPEVLIVDPGRPIKQKDDRIHIECGRWHHIMMCVKVNDIGARNGAARAWYDGRLAVDVQGFEFRDNTCKANNLLIDGVYFSTFFGGRGENYQPVKDEYILFDDFTISREPFFASVPALESVPE